MKHSNLDNMDNRNLRDDSRMLDKYNTVRLKDALYTLRSDSGANVDYCRGLVIGLISALEYKGYTFKECCSIIYMNLPSGYRRECLPETVAEFIVEG
jgi:hypothetical protein